jgi:hypothetical protein
MSQRTTPLLFIGITIDLIATVVTLPVVFFPYAETTKDPDAIQFVVWFLSIGLLLLGFLFVPITIGVWLFKRNQSNDNRF